MFLCYIFIAITQPVLYLAENKKSILYRPDVLIALTCAL